MSSITFVQFCVCSITTDSDNFIFVIRLFACSLSYQNVLYISTFFCSTKSTSHPKHILLYHISFTHLLIQLLNLSTGSDTIQCTEILPLWNHVWINLIKTILLLDLSHATRYGSKTKLPLIFDNYMYFFKFCSQFGMNLHFLWGSQCLNWS